MANSRLDKLLEMLQNQPEDPFLIYAVGLEYEAGADFTNAMQQYAILLEKQPDYLPVYYQAALLQANLGKPTEAIRLLETGITLAQNQHDQKTLRELRQTLEEIGDLLI